VALALAGEGAAVTLVSRSSSDLETLAEKIDESGGRSFVCAGDLREPGFCDRAVAAAVTAHGGLDVLVNNAGVGGSAPVAETSDELWDRILATNLTAVFRMTRAALPDLARRGGHVFMISSLAGSNPIAGMAAYCASKAALDHFARCLMLEVRHQGIKVTTIAPGSVETGFGGSRSGASWKLQPEDVADAVVDLLRSREGAHLSRVEMRPLRPPSGA
jgi:3-oxoacyl-[acyl-carrier protein] reductase